MRLNQAVRLRARFEQNSLRHQSPRLPCSVALRALVLVTRDDEYGSHLQDYGCMIP